MQCLVFHTICKSWDFKLKIILHESHSAIQETIASFKLDILTVKAGISIFRLTSKMFNLLKFLIFFSVSRDWAMLLYNTDVSRFKKISSVCNVCIQCHIKLFMRWSIMFYFVPAVILCIITVRTFSCTVVRICCHCQICLNRCIFTY